MNKKIYALAAIILSLSFTFYSCGDDDEDVDDAWKSRNEQAFNALANDDNYKEVKSPASPSANLFVYSKPSSVITDSDLKLKTTPTGTPEATDSVRCRYEGWYYDATGEKIIFDSTERPSLNNSTDPNKVERQFYVGSQGLIEGWRTVLQDMKSGEEREVVIPWTLGYGASGTTNIPAYTTLWFNIKLTKIIPMRTK